MLVLLGAFDALLATLRVAVFVIAVVAAGVAVLDWMVRTRRVSPFGGVARFCRRVIDPLLEPIEHRVVRSGGLPTAAPWWALGATMVGGLALLYGLGVIRGAIGSLAQTQGDVRLLVLLGVTWAFQLVVIALVVRVILSWIRISPFSRIARVSHALTDWIVVPLRRIVPTFGVVDITPVVAYFLVTWVLEPIVLGVLSRVIRV